MFTSYFDLQMGQAKKGHNNYLQTQLLLNTFTAQLKE